MIVCNVCISSEGKRHMEIRREKETFIIRILGTENATWQGSITWTEKNKVQHFRSALELLRMIDTVLAEKNEPEGSAE